MLLLIGLSVASPHRVPHDKPARVDWAPGLRDDVVHVKLVEGQLEEPTIAGAVDVRPLFRDPAELAGERARFDPDEQLADLTTWFRVQVAPGAGPELAMALNEDPRVEVATLALAAVRPPEDLDPTTPDFTDQQSYLDAAPTGMGATVSWPGARGEHVVVADIEYGWEPDHEELSRSPSAFSWGHTSDSWTFHGNMVLSILVGQDDGYGVTGFVPDATSMMISPYADVADYDVAAAIDGATALLGPGDVLLIEQQVSANGGFAPVESSPAVFDAISLAVAKGIVVIEPAGNGGQDLDAVSWEGWFDRDTRDSGAILVGGGASPEDTSEPLRGWNGVSCYGSRVDVQGVSSYTVVSATTGDYEPDLFFPDGDDRQAYTTQFGGTSAASAMVAGVAASFQSAAIESTGVPWDPVELRALMVGTGTPQSDASPQHIGPQPDLAVMLQTAGLH
ncbi:MAG: S8 family serine peptidase [Proteobacteria bacterium]|nr:S8 family serine peptidase [Pseudomonadota bacterium]MCP4915552.1 S8 family serine peptidase [Pseudomonadota bacterium]